jgi:hypothetical protein
MSINEVRYFFFWNGSAGDMYLRGDAAYQSLNQLVKNYIQASNIHLDDIQRVVKEMKHMESLKIKYNPKGDQSIQVLSIKDMKKWNFHVEFLLQLNVIPNDDKYGTMRMCYDEGGLHLDNGYSTIFCVKPQTPNDDVPTTSSDDTCSDDKRCENCVHCLKTKICDKCHCVGGCYDHCVYLKENVTEDTITMTCSDLSFITEYAETPCRCGEDDCSGLECQYNQLCGGCRRVLGIMVGIHCIEHPEHGETVVCNMCYDDNEELFADDKWTVQ